MQEGRDVFFVLPKRFLRGKLICHPDVFILKVGVVGVCSGLRCESFVSCSSFNPAGRCRQNLWPAGRTVTSSLGSGHADELR